jgi:hypothetical protein
MDKIEPSILEYLGKFEQGILVLISLSVGKEYYEGTFYYDQENIVLTVSEQMEEKYGDIKKNPQYSSIIKNLLQKIVPFKDMYGRLDSVDFSKWVKGVIEVHSKEYPEILNDSEVKPLLRFK